MFFKYSNILIAFIIIYKNIRKKQLMMYFLTNLIIIIPYLKLPTTIIRFDIYKI